MACIRSSNHHIHSSSGDENDDVCYSEPVCERYGDSNGFDSDNEANGLSDDDDEWEIYDSTSIPKLQFRNDMWRARWDGDLSMAEVLKNTGKMATTTGDIRGWKLFCSIEETLFLSERGALCLEGLMSDDHPHSLKDLYVRVSGNACGCSWELFEAYGHLKSLGYIVVRHGVPWTIKTKKNEILTSVHEAASTKEGLERDFSVLALADHSHSSELRPHFDVYLPNSKFRKSSPGNPSFKLHVFRGLPPSKHDIQILETKCDGIPLKICHVDHGSVSYLAFSKAQLPELP